MFLHKFKTTIAAAVAAAAIFAAAGPAAAASCGTTGNLDTTNVLISGTPDIAATDCAGMFEGNDGDFVADLNAGLFAGLLDDWTFFGKSDDGGSGVTADENNVGSWSIDFGSSVYSVFAVTIKAANSYAVWLFDLRPGSTTGLTDGTFNISAVEFLTGQGINTGADLSHMSVAVYDATPIPLPAAGLLLIAALGGLGLMRRRQTA